MLIGKNGEVFWSNVTTVSFRVGLLGAFDRFVQRVECLAAVVQVA